MPPSMQNGDCGRIEMSKRRKDIFEYTMEDVDRAIRNYPEDFSTPKYLQFMKRCICAGFKVRLHKAETTNSKYVYVDCDVSRFKVRFSNHKPSIENQLEKKNCDFFVGITHDGVYTTNDAWNAMIERFKKKGWKEVDNCKS